MSDPEGTFDAMTKLSEATDLLLLAAGTGEPTSTHVHLAWQDRCTVCGLRVGRRGLYMSTAAPLGHHFCCLCKYSLDIRV